MKSQKEKEKEKDIITKEKCLLNWNIPLFINYPFKDIVAFIRKEFSTKDNDLLLLIRLYQEICIMQKDDPQKGFNIFLSEDTNEKITTEKELNLIQNIKRLLYYTCDEKNQNQNQSQNINEENKSVFNSINNERPFLFFLKKNFAIFISIFKSGGFNEKNKTKDEKELDLKFKLTFGFDNDINKYLEDNNNNDNNNNKMDIEEENIEINENKDKDNNTEKIKLEIINIYNFILTTYNDLEKPEEDIINFSQIIVKYLVIYLSKDKDCEILNKLKKSISLIIGLYIKTFKEEKSIYHPIRIIFQHVLKYLIKTILFNEIKESNKIEMENYYKNITSIYNILLNQNNKDLLNDFQNIVIYYSKQLIYENVDSAKFRNPLELKNINCLNDIDKKIIFHPYLFNILILLDEENANAFLGFYIRLFYVSEKNKLLYCKENILKCLNYFIKINWLQKEYNALIKILNDDKIEYDKIKKINEFVFLFLKTNKSNQSNHKATEKLQYLFKNIILENINSLN